MATEKALGRMYVGVKRDGLNVGDVSHADLTDSGGVPVM
jgi:hypothetical protein